MSSRPDAIRIREIGAEAMNEILELRRAVFPHEELDKLDPRYFRWAFVHGRHGPARIFVAEDENGALAGSYTVVPQRFAVRGVGEVRGSIVVDVMSHPAFRRRGIFTALGRTAMRANGEGGTAFACGYPVRPEVMPGHLNIGWRERFAIPVLVKPLDLTALAHRFLPGPAARAVGAVGQLASRALGPWSRRALSVEDLGPARPGSFDELGREVDLLWEATRPRAAIQQVRDRPYLEWRYARHPTRSYRLWLAREAGRLLALVVTTRRDVRGFRTHAIADVLTADPPLGDEALVETLARLEQTLAQEAEAELLIALVPRGSFAHRVFRRAGFLPGPGATVHFILFESHPCIPPSLRDSSASWCLLWGDTDDV